MNSIRRYLLDKNLFKYKTYFENMIVLDAGGTKKNRRGKFNPKKIRYKKWIVLNINSRANPDIVCDVKDIPVQSNYFDTVLMTELLEYLIDPILALKELNRVLKKNGTLIISVPFVHPLHGDKDLDYYRYTKNSLITLSNKAGFKVEKIQIMGSTIAVIYDILRVNLSYNKNYLYKFFYIILIIFNPIIKLIYNKFNLTNEYINTGYFLVLKK